MAENRDSNYLSPLEEEYIREAEADGDLDQQLLREKELAAQKLWLSFQDSATAVAHLFRDCQQQAGLSAWVPFHESASAVTQLYKGSSDVCRQCMECGVKYGQRRKTRDVIAWAKKKRRLIKREELLAFLLDKPYPPDHSLSESHSRMEDHTSDPPPHTCPPSLQFPRQTHAPSSPLNYLQTPCFTSATTTNPISSPRRWALFRDDGLLSESDVYGGIVRENGRKRPSSTDCGSTGTIGVDTSVAKRMKL